MQEHHELEEAGRHSRVLAVVQIAEEVAEEALLGLIRLGCQVDVNDQVVRLGGVLEAVVPACFDERRVWPARLARQHGERFRVGAAVPVAGTLLHAEELVLIDVIVEGRRGDGDSVVFAVGRYNVRHAVVRVWRPEGDGRAPFFVDDRVVGGIVRPHWSSAAKEGEHSDGMLSSLLSRSEYRGTRRGLSRTSGCCLVRLT